MNLLASNFLNSIFGMGAFGENSLLNTGKGTNANSPFAALLGEDGDASKGAKPTLSGLLSDNKGIATIEEVERDTSLSSPDLLLSDLLSVNWESLQKGDTLTLASGWTISVNQDGSMALADPDGELAFPSFTPEQLREVLNQFKSAGLDFLPLMKDDRKIGEDAKPKQDTADKRDVAEKTKPNTSESELKSSPETASVSNTTASASTDTTTSTGNPLQPLLDAALHQEQALRNAYLHAPTSVYAGAGVRGIATPATPSNASNTMTASTAFHSSPMPKSVAGTTLTLNGVDTPFVVAEGAMADDAFFDDAATAQLPAQMQQQGIRVGTDGQLYGTSPVPPAQLNVIIQKMAEKPDTRVLTVRLDPPELGRVQVQLSAGADKVVKAAIMVEKPEALSLLKRDMTTLEKALSDAGVSVDDQGISLDLAMDNGGGDNPWAQQEFLALQREQNGARANSGTDVANSNSDDATGTVDDDEFYQSDLAVNIKV